MRSAGVLCCSQGAKCQAEVWFSNFSVRKGWSCCSAVMLHTCARLLLALVTQPIRSSVIFVMVRPDEGGLGFSTHSSQSGG